jgi:lysophospholipase L1-like esterase
MKKHSLSLWLFLLLPTLLFAQDPTRFAEELRPILEEKPEAYPTGDVIVFTGSSSIRMWTDIQDHFPNHNILNRGFGGSHFSDLIYYRQDLIVKYQPRQVLIYEGDNDLAEGKKVGRVLRDAKKLYKLLREESPETIISFLAAKPSLSRLHLREDYERYNQKLEQFCRKEGIDFVDVWTYMLGTAELVREDLFIEDGLHMNDRGYQIWADVIGPYLREKKFKESAD